MNDEDVLNNARNRLGLDYPEVDIEIVLPQNRESSNYQMRIL